MCLASHEKDILVGKPCRPRSERGLWTGSTLCAYKNVYQKYELCSLISAIGFFARKSALPPKSEH